MTPEQITALTDLIYVALFGVNGAVLRVRFGLPPRRPEDVADDDLRDCLGTMALQALADIEHELTKYAGQPLDFHGWRKVTMATSQRLGREWKRRAYETGIVLLTGEKLP